MTGVQTCALPIYLAVANTASPAAPLLATLLGNGDGTFQVAASYYGPANGTESYSRIATGDFNGDGKADVVLIDSTISEAVAVFLGNGDGTFRKQVTLTPGLHTSSLAVGDVNGDGKLDLVIANFDGGLAVYLGNGDGTFQAKADLHGGGRYISAAVIGDFSGNGKGDLAVLDDLEGITVRLGNGDGTFQAPISVSTISGGFLTAGDFNGDGRTDLVISDIGESGRFSVLLGGGIYPDLSISVTSASFNQGQVGATYNVSVSNVGTGASSGTVTVNGSVPTAVTATAIAGSGWACTLAGLTCTRSDPLANGASYPITVTVSVANNAPATVTIGRAHV